ncbi:polysaccharide deacetylase family protein [Actinorugispora endophytica]|uniref:Peptidoglycan/xylan/chitin deacetylase (PgdA/CDA1 family) n=1 Tax=Actinorugispora endophytica TaxID=1605990 RepID=A0A4R6V2P2_9ACTN|nr:polysaccharide deacetylase family protein [Actinorugispora endophytica]TDQ52397.1 peptidoglycan/xylan/chitin deacetylase (PgdA/CDA1 family) [Actinorugispora endophytica]
MTNNLTALPFPVRAAATAASAVLLLGACAPGDTAEPVAGDESPPPTPVSGEPDELTVVDRSLVPGLEEESSTEGDGIDVDVAYPVVPGAAPLTEFLGDATARELDDFRAANPGAVSFAMGWELTAAGGDVVGVRFTQDEEDSEGPRTGYSTYWYDGASGYTAHSTELLAGQAELDRLNEAVKDELDGRDGVDGASVHPILGLYDSIGFNPAGDLVVEFDAGSVAPVSEDRVVAVVPSDEADPLLSDLGRRAKAAATVVTPDFALPATPASPAPATPAPGPESAVPGVLTPRGDSVDCSSPDSKCVALTFDDGPGARTGELLDMLAGKDARATFFVTGEPVREHPLLVRRAYAEGHEIANHTVRHPDLTTLSAEGVDAELRTVNALIRRETGYTPDLMRPPYGATDDTVAEVSAEHGMAEILWSVDTNDWRDRDSGVVSKRALDAVQPGSIVLMHDIHSTTVDAVPSILEGLDERGYTMVTVGQLLGDTEPGTSYSAGPPVTESPETSVG